MPINDDIIIEELIKDNPKPKYVIAQIAGSEAVSQANQSKAIYQKIKTSKKIQDALARHRERTLEVQTELQEKLADRIRSEALHEKLSADQAFTHLNKASAMVTSLTKEKGEDNQSREMITIEKALIQLASARSYN